MNESTQQGGKAVMITPTDLKVLPVFDTFTSSQLKAVGDRGELQELSPEETVFRQNDPAGMLYGLLEGQVELTFVYKDKLLETDIEYEESVISRYKEYERPVVLEVLLKGELFGWSSMAGNQKYTATAVTVQPSRLFAIRAAALRTVLEDNPGLGYVFMDHLSRVIAKRLHWRTERLVESWVEAFGTDRVG